LQSILRKISHQFSALRSACRKKESEENGVGAVCRRRIVEKKGRVGEGVGDRAERWEVDEAPLPAIVEPEG